MGSSKLIMPSTFNRRITVKRVATASDAAGGTKTTGYTTRFQTWAAIDQMNTSRKAYYGLDLFTNFYELMLRYTPDRIFTTADLVDYEGGTFTVNSAQVVELNYKRFTILICTQTEVI